MFFIRAAALKDDAGHVLRWFGTNTDVTPLQQAQSELKAASARKDQFLAMLAHELRNPLAPISTAAQLLARVQSDPALVQKASMIISRQADHMTALLDELLDVSRVQRGRIHLKNEVLDMHGILHDAIEQAQVHFSTQQQVLHASLPTSPCCVRGDRTRLVQVFRTSSTMRRSTRRLSARSSWMCTRRTTPSSSTSAIPASGCRTRSCPIFSSCSHRANGRRTAPRADWDWGCRWSGSSSNCKADTSRRPAPARARAVRSRSVFHAPPAQ
jgi:hypothetical protein